MNASPARNRRGLTRLFVILVVLSSTFGNFFLAAGLNRLPPFETVSLGAYIVLFAQTWQIFVGVGLLALWMAAQLTMFSWADLTYVLPVTASAYILNQFVSKFMLHEQISPARWVGAILIAVGSTLAAFTPVQTVPHGTDAEFVP